MMAKTNTKRPGSTGVAPTLEGKAAEEMRKLMAKAGGKRPDGMNISMTKLLQGMSADELFAVFDVRTRRATSGWGDML